MVWSIDFKIQIFSKDRFHRIFSSMGPLLYEPIRILNPAIVKLLVYLLNARLPSGRLPEAICVICQKGLYLFPEGIVSFARSKLCFFVSSVVIFQPVCRRTVTARARISTHLMPSVPYTGRISTHLMPSVPYTGNYILERGAGGDHLVNICWLGNSIFA